MSERDLDDLFESLPASFEVPAVASDVQAIRHVLWYFGDSRGYEPGTFTARLLGAFAAADPENLEILTRGFPALGFWFWTISRVPHGALYARRALESLGVSS